LKRLHVEEEKTRQERLKKIALEQELEKMKPERSRETELLKKEIEKLTNANKELKKTRKGMISNLSARDYSKL